ncbi:MAG: TRAP transporter substrate-binding protein [Acidobacteriota bacterium]
MKRRDFLRTALGGTLLGAAGATVVGACAKPDQDASSASESAPAVHTGKRVRWRLASSFPRGLDTIFGAADVLAERLSAATGGRFEIRVYPAGELVPPFQVLDAAQKNTVQVAHTAGYYFTGKNPALAFDCCVPFGLTSRQQTAWLSEGGGLELMRELYADFGVISFPGGNTGAQMGGWFKQPVTSLEQLRGLKIRIPGLGGQVMDRLGATVQVLAGGDIYPALERGAIDATEWVGPYDDEKLGFHKVARFYHYPGWWEPGPSLSFLVNRKAWDELPLEYQQLFEAATQESGLIMQARYDDRNPAALERLTASGEVTLQRFPDDVLQAAKSAAFELYEELAAQDPGYRKVYDAWRQTRRQAQRWFSTAELAYATSCYGEP